MLVTKDDIGEGKIFGSAWNIKGCSRDYWNVHFLQSTPFVASRPISKHIRGVPCL